MKHHNVMRRVGAFQLLNCRIFDAKLLLFTSWRACFLCSFLCSHSIFYILQLSVTVEIVEGPSKGVYEVRVKEKSPVIVVIFKVARSSGFVLKSTSAIFEVCEALKIRRFLS